MPHLTLQATKNVLIKHPDTLLNMLNQALWGSGEFAQAAEIKSRIIPVDDFLVGVDDQDKTQGFVYAELKIMPGRSEATKQRLASLIMAALQQYFSQHAFCTDNQVEVQLCIEVVEIAAVYNKQSLSL